METLIKNLHTFVSIAMRNPCTGMHNYTRELPCMYTLPKTQTHKCSECIFETPNTKNALSVIKIIGEHSERID